MLAISRSFSLLHRYPVRGTLLLIWLWLLYIQPDSVNVLMQYAGFLFLGVIGAIFANATGAGGGVVFVPFFSQLQMDNSTILATSFAIQCCGMTAGAITWWRFYLSQKNRHSVTLNDVNANQAKSEWQAIIAILLLCIPFSIVGILFAQYVFTDSFASLQSGLNIYFGAFSIFLALCIFGSLKRMNLSTSRYNLSAFDIIALLVISLFGGIVTAVLSVGVGELVAVYLILRGFNVTMSIASAVILSAFTVWSAIYYHAVVVPAVYWQVLLFAGAGAIMGGIFAKRVVLFFSPVKLKVFFASWVLIMGIAGLPIF